MISYPHRLRLRGPWEAQFPGQPAVRVAMPHLWQQSGTVQLRRRFGYPGTIDADERVWLVLQAIPGTRSVAVNGHRLLRMPEGESAVEVEVTPLLQQRNELLLEADIEPGPEPWGEAALEIRRTAFLRGLSVQRRGDILAVAGAIAGSASRPLEVYLLCDGRHAGYGTFPAGQPFELPIEGEPGGSLRVDLVDGAIIWYTVELVL